MKYVPVGILIDADGRLARPVSMVNIDDPSFRRELEDWVSTGTCPQTWLEGTETGTTATLSSRELQSDTSFQKAVSRLEDGDTESALEELNRAVALDPENWLIRKQVWALENPGAFYDGEVDYDWQKARIKAENERGLSDKAGGPPS